MVCYVDTSVLVALCVNEPKSEDVSRWYSKCKDKLVSSVWCVTEFASALGIKQRTGQITTAEAQVAWQNFQRLCTTQCQATENCCGCVLVAAKLFPRIYPWSPVIIDLFKIHGSRELQPYHPLQVEKEAHPIPAFPRERGKEPNTPSLARSAGEGWGGGKKLPPIMKTSIEPRIILATPTTQRTMFEMRANKITTRHNHADHAVTSRGAWRTRRALGNRGVPNTLL